MNSLSFEDKVIQALQKKEKKELKVLGEEPVKLPIDASDILPLIESIEEDKQKYILPLYHLFDRETREKLDVYLEDYKYERNIDADILYRSHMLNPRWVAVVEKNAFLEEVEKGLCNKSPADPRQYRWALIPYISRYQRWDLLDALLGKTQDRKFERVGDWNPINFISVPRNILYETASKYKSYLCSDILQLLNDDTEKETLCDDDFIFVLIFDCLSLYERHKNKLKDVRLPSWKEHLYLVDCITIGERILKVMIQDKSLELYEPSKYRWSKDTIETLLSSDLVSPEYKEKCKTYLETKLSK